MSLSIACNCRTVHKHRFLSDTEKEATAAALLVREQRDLVKGLPDGGHKDAHAKELRKLEEMHAAVTAQVQAETHEANMAEDLEAHADALDGLRGKHRDKHLVEMAEIQALVEKAKHEKLALEKEAKEQQRAAAFRAQELKEEEAAEKRNEEPGEVAFSPSFSASACPD
jgi:hypothetical protein